MPLICQNWPNWHPVNVSNVLLIGWPKLDKWHLAKIMGSQGFYVCRLHLYPCPHVAVVWQKKRGFLVAVLTIVHTHCVFPDNGNRYEYIFLHLRTFINFVFLPLLWSRHSCPVASCTYIVKQCLLPNLEFQNEAWWENQAPDVGCIAEYQIDWKDTIS